MCAVKFQRNSLINKVSKVVNIIVMNTKQSFNKWKHVTKQKIESLLNENNVVIEIKHSLNQGQFSFNGNCRINFVAKLRRILRKWHTLAQNVLAKKQMCIRLCKLNNKKLLESCLKSWYSYYLLHMYKKVI